MTAVLDQGDAIADWLAGVPDADFACASVLPGWDVRTLVAHVVGIYLGLERLIDRPTVLSDQRQQLHDSLARLRRRLADPLPRALDTERGPTSTAEFLKACIVESVVHADDLSRSLPDREPVALVRAALAEAVRTLADRFAKQAPGRSVEVRVPPFVAVQAVPGPRHTRGTPPNVVETDALTWLRLVTGRITFAEALANGAVRASGTRADLSAHLPVQF